MPHMYWKLNPLLGTLGLPQFNTISSFSSQPGPCYLNSVKLFLISSDQNCNPQAGFELGT